MAESYFNWLTEQQGPPAKPFDALEELKQLRRKLAQRLQASEMHGQQSVQPIQPPPQPSIQEPVQAFVGPSPVEPSSQYRFAEAEPGSFGLTLENVADMRAAMASVTPQSEPPVLCRTRLQPSYNAPDTSHVHQPHTVHMPDVPKDSVLETVNAGFIALGIIGVVFGLLSFYRGWESDLTAGTLASASGAAIVLIGLCGRLLASK